MFVRLDPLAGGTGGGGTQNSGGNTRQLVDDHGSSIPVASNTNTTTQAVEPRLRGPDVRGARILRRLLRRERRLRRHRERRPVDARLDPRALTTYTGARTGTSRSPPDSTSRADGHRHARARLRDDPGGALSTDRDAAADGRFGRARHTYERQWRRYDASLTRPRRELAGPRGAQYYRSVNVVKASEDKTFPGAIAAGLASPWGQSVPAGNATNGKPTYFGSYREVFARDLYEAFAGLLVAGDVRTARDATRFLFMRQQQPDGSMPRNSLLNGKVAPDTGGLQLDETSYPILMAWQSGLAGDGALYRNHIDPGRRFPRCARAA